MEILPNNIYVAADGYWENTCRAAPPSVSDPSGRIVVFPGQPRPILYVFSRPIYDATGGVDVNPASSVMQQFDDPGYLDPHTDNHVVRLADGNFLAMKGCSYWKTPDHPQPWQQLTFQNHEYLRGACVLWRHDPKDGSAWPLQGAVDPFIVENGRYGHPRDPTSPDGNMASDRPELYACPFTGYVYLTELCRCGAYTDSSGTAIPAFDGIRLFYSKNQGKDWDIVETNLDWEFASSLPLVMTSTPNGRLFLYQWANDANNALCGKLFCTQPLKSGETPVVYEIGGSTWHDFGDAQSGYYLSYEANAVYYWERTKGNPPIGTMPKQWPPDPDIAARSLNNIPTPSISRVSTDQTTSRVRVSFPALNEHQRTVVAIIDFGVVDTSDGPALELGSLRRVARIEAEKPVTHSVLHGTFIDPDYLDTPTGFASNTSLFYWLEWPGRGRTPQVTCATNPKTGDLHVLALDQNGGLWHTIRQADPPAWPYKLGDVHAAVPGPSIGPTVGVACATNPKTGDLHVLALDQNGGLWHTIRQADPPAWSAPFDDVLGSVPSDPFAGSPGRARSVACATNSDGDLHVLLVGPVDDLWHTVRKANPPHWPDPWVQLTYSAGSVVPGEGPSLMPQAACATNPQGDLHVLALDESGRLWHTLRHADGTWPEPFVDVAAKVPAAGSEAAVPGEWPGFLVPAFQVTCATNEQGALHVLLVVPSPQEQTPQGEQTQLVQPSGGLRHLVRWADGSWFNSWPDVPSPVAIYVMLTWIDVAACAVDLKTGDLHVLAIDNTEGLWYTLYAALASTPIARSMQPDQEQVFVCGSDGNIYTRQWVSGAGWGDWLSLGAPPGGFDGWPAAVARNPQCTNLYVSGSDHALWVRAYDGDWGDWKTLGMYLYPWGDVQSTLPLAEPPWFPNDMSARCCLLDGWPSQASALSALSVKNGALRTWPGVDFGGDYLSGGFFYWKGNNYIAQWREPDGIHANIVRLLSEVGR
jgi:hypothetical protein